jgi:CheY-like chemotaxis protein
MKIHAEYSPTAPPFDPALPESSRALPFAPWTLKPWFWQARSGDGLKNNAAPFARYPSEPGAIYVVDDDESLRLLYGLFLRANDYVVRTFRDRAAALSALENDAKGPDLLIMDYLGHAMPVDRFLHRTLAAHPTLRILMVSGLSPDHLRFSKQRPDRFLQKPFTPEELLMEVRAALTV